MNKRTANDVNLIPLDDAELIGFASSKGDDRNRWVELSVFALPDGRFLAQVEAKSILSGERTKTRRLAAHSHHRALKLIEDSEIGVIVREEVEEWVERKMQANGAAGGVWNDESALRALYGQPEGRKGYAALLEDDFGIGESTTRAALKNGNPVKVPLAAIMQFIDLPAFHAYRAKDGVS